MVLLIDHQSALQRVQQLKRMMGLSEVSFRNTVVSWKTLLQNFMVWKPEMRLISYRCSIFKNKKKEIVSALVSALTQASCSEKQCQGIPVVWSTCGLAGATLKGIWGCQIGSNWSNHNLGEPVHVCHNSIPGTSGNLLKN